MPVPNPAEQGPATLVEQTAPRYDSLHETTWDPRLEQGVGMSATQVGRERHLTRGPRGQERLMLAVAVVMTVTMFGWQGYHLYWADGLPPSSRPPRSSKRSIRPGNARSVWSKTWNTTSWYWGTTSPVRESPIGQTVMRPRLPRRRLRPLRRWPPPVRA